MPLQIRVVATAVTVNLLCVLPPFLTGVMAVQIGRGFGVSPASLGTLISAFALGSIVSSAPLGRRVAHWGVQRCLRWSTQISALALIVASLSTAPWMLAVAMFVSGVANGMGQPAANALIASQLPHDRHGIAYAVKQSGVPLATLLAGLAVPLVALRLGWQWAYVMGLVLAVLGYVLAPADRRIESELAEGQVAGASRRSLWLLALGVGFAVIAATSVGAVGSAGGVAAGLSEAAAGYLVALGGITALVVRLWVGWMADRRRFDELRATSALLMTGVFAWALMSLGLPAPYAIGLIAANAFGWGWPGLTNLSLARRFPQATAAASGVVQTGLSVGLLVGPAMLATLADSAGWTITWLTTAACGLIGAVIIGQTAGKLGPQVTPRPATAH